jgi:hypothetical protein
MARRTERFDMKIGHNDVEPGVRPSPPGSFRYNTELIAAIGDRVLIDNDQSLQAVVIGILLQRGRILYDLTWFANGIKQNDYFEDWRLTNVSAA